MFWKVSCKSGSAVYHLQIHQFLPWDIATVGSRDNFGLFFFQKSKTTVTVCLPEGWPFMWELLPMHISYMLIRFSKTSCLLAVQSVPSQKQMMNRPEREGKIVPGHHPFKVCSRLVLLFVYALHFLLSPPASNCVSFLEGKDVPSALVAFRWSLFQPFFSLMTVKVLNADEICCHKRIESTPWLGSWYPSTGRRLVKPEWICRLNLNKC